MTDKTKYSNISVNKKTYADLQRLSKEILPGETPISISKTVTYLVNCKIEESDNFLNKIQHQTLINYEHKQTINKRKQNEKKGDKNVK